MLPCRGVDRPTTWHMKNSVVFFESSSGQGSDSFKFYGNSFVFFLPLLFSIESAGKFRDDDWFLTLCVPLGKLAANIPTQLGNVLVTRRHIAALCNPFVKLFFKQTGISNESFF